jgi:hypothetical protein
VFNALRETQKESIKSIRQRDDYIYLLYEGVLTFGMLPTTEEDPRLYDFLRDVVLKFELMYTEKLHQDTIFERSNFEEFHEIVKKMSNELVDIDVKSLSHYINQLSRSSFENFIIFETKHFHPIFKSIKDSRIGNHADRLTPIFRYMMDFTDRIDRNFQSSEFNFNDLKVITINTPAYLIAFFLQLPLKGNGSVWKDIDHLTRKLKR